MDLLTTTADPFSVATADVLLNLYQTKVGDPAISGYATHTIDLTSFLAAHKGQTLRLRFAEVDNRYFFQFGVDQVVLTINPPSGPGGGGSPGAAPGQGAGGGSAPPRHVMARGSAGKPHGGAFMAPPGGHGAGGGGLAVVRPRG